MAFTNPNDKTQLMGFNIPNIVLYGILGLLVFVFFSLWKGIRNTFSNIFGSDGATGIFGQSTQKDILKDTIRRLEDNPNVKSQMNVANEQKAASLLNAMQGAGTDEETIFKIFDSITGPYQFAAIYVIYGVRKLTVAPSWLSFLPPVLFANGTGGYEGDLIGALKNELTAKELDKVTSAGKHSIRYKIDNYLKSVK